MYAPRQRGSVRPSVAVFCAVALNVMTWQCVPRCALCTAMWHPLAVDGTFGLCEVHLGGKQNPSAVCSAPQRCAVALGEGPLGP